MGLQTGEQHDDEDDEEQDGEHGDDGQHTAIGLQHLLRPFQAATATNTMNRISRNRNNQYRPFISLDVCLALA